MPKNILIGYICSNPNCRYFIDKIDVEYFKIDILKQCPRCKENNSFQPLYKERKTGKWLI